MRKHHDIFENVSTSYVVDLRAGRLVTASVCAVSTVTLQNRVPQTSTLLRAAANIQKIKLTHNLLENAVE